MKKILLPALILLSGCTVNKYTVLVFPIQEREPKAIENVMPDFPFPLFTVPDKSIIYDLTDSTYIFPDSLRYEIDKYLHLINPKTGAARKN